MVNYHLSILGIEVKFEHEDRKFDIEVTIRTPPATKKDILATSQSLEDNFFFRKPGHSPDQLILAEISQYLGNEPESSKNILLMFLGMTT